MKSKTYAEKKLHSIDADQMMNEQAHELVRSVQGELQKVQEINAVVLFGSFARGDHSLRHSDIDIMVFLDREKRDAPLEEKIRKKIIRHNLGKRIAVHTLFQYRHLDDEERGLMLTIAREGKVLFARKTLVISSTVLGLRAYVLIRFDTTGKKPAGKNKLQRFLYGYSGNGKRYKGIVDGEKVFSAGQGAIMAPEAMRRKLMIFAQQADITAMQKGKFWKR